MKKLLLALLLMITLLFVGCGNNNSSTNKTKINTGTQKIYIFDQKDLVLAKARAWFPEEKIVNMLNITALENINPNASNELWAIELESREWDNYLQYNIRRDYKGEIISINRNRNRSNNGKQKDINNAAIKYNKMIKKYNNYLYDLEKVYDGYINSFDNIKVEQLTWTCDNDSIKIGVQGREEYIKIDYFIENIKNDLNDYIFYDLFANDNLLDSIKNNHGKSNEYLLFINQNLNNMKEKFKGQKASFYKTK